jgi:lysophospholipase L1-like esterase
MSRIQELLVKRFIEPAHKMKQSQFEELPPGRGSVVFIGDSITAGGAWHEWFPEHSVVNRGIDGDTSVGVRNRIRAALGDGPSAVSILIGTNDIRIGRKPAEILSDVEATLTTVSTHSPEARILLHGILPRQAKFHSRIREINARYALVAEQLGAKYVDTWPTFADGDALRSDFTLDGLHLNGAAYRAWAGILRPLLTPGQG